MLTQVNCYEITYVKLDYFCILDRPELPSGNTSTPAKTSTMKLMDDDNEEKEAYYKSFETDSFDLEDCFNGSTQPQNSSLLSNRLRERALPDSDKRADNLDSFEKRNRLRMENQYTLGKLLPTPSVNDIIRTTSSPTNLPTHTPLKPPSFQAPLNSFLAGNTDPLNDPANEVIKKTIKNSLRDLLASEPLG